MEGPISLEIGFHNRIFRSHCCNSSLSAVVQRLMAGPPFDTPARAASFKTLPTLVGGVSGLAGTRCPRIFALEQETDQLSLPMGARLIENLCQIGFGSRNGDIAPPCRSRAAVPFQNLR